MELLDKIKDDYAKEMLFYNWDSLVYSLGYSKLLLEHENKVMQLYAEAYFEENKKSYAMECLKRAAENAEINNDSCYNQASYCNNTYIIKESIVNENNLI